MLENMGMLLPAYEEYVTKLQARLQQQNRGNCDRLLEALAYIYTDLLQFCFDAFKMLSKKSSSKCLQSVAEFVLLIFGRISSSKKSLRQLHELEDI